MATADAKPEQLFRYSSVESDSANDAERTIQVAFSSETPVLRQARQREVDLGIVTKKGEKYWELLSHRAEDADFTILNSGTAAVLDEHQNSIQLGNVKKARLSSDGVGRGVLEFDGLSELSKTRFEQMKTGKRPGISFGYIHTRFVGDEGEREGYPVKRIAFCADEISSVRIPADAVRAGVRRSADGQWCCIGCGESFDRLKLSDDYECPQCAQNSANRSANPPPTQTAPPAPVDSAGSVTVTPNQPPTKNNMSDNATLDANKLRAELEPQIRSAVENEFKTRSGAEAEKLNARNAEIRALANSFVKDHGQKWNGKPGEVVVVGERIRAFEAEACAAPADHSAAEVRSDFKRRVHEILEGARAPLNQVEAANLDESLAGRCSLGRVLSEASKASEKGQRTQCFVLSDGAEYEADRELRNKAQHYPGGAGCPQEGQLLPNNIRVPVLRGQSSGRMQRDTLAQDFATAGALISPQFQTPIELLRNKMVLGRAGITVFSGVTGGQLVFPRLTSPTTSQSLAEGAALASYDQTFDQVKMSPKRIGSSQNYSRLSLLQASSNLEAIIWDDHMTTNALRADYLGLNGSGAGDEPLGILNQVGIGTVLFGGSAANAYKNCVALETAIRQANIDEPPVFVTTSKSRGTLRITPATLTGSTVVSGTSNALWVGDQLIDRTAIDSQQIPNDVLVALVGRHIMMASWSGLSVILDTITLAKQDKYVLTMNQYIDFALRHAQAVARSADSIAALA